MNSVSEYLKHYQGKVHKLSSVLVGYQIGWTIVQCPPEINWGTRIRHALLKTDCITTLES